MPMLAITNLNKRFGNKQVIRDLNLTVEVGTIYGFIGQNGAGKTTTMKMILGLLASDSGTIHVNGEKVTYGANQTNQYIGYLADVPEFYDYLTAEEYLQLCAEITQLPKNEQQQRITKLLSLVGLEANKKRIRSYSRGMKQRLGIAQALLNRPKLLICDEPTSALDPVGRKEILEILASVKQETTIIFSTHILADVERICDQVGFLHAGQLVLTGSVEAMKQQHQTQQFEIEFTTNSECQKFLALDSRGEQMSPTIIRYQNTPQLVQTVMKLCVQHEIDVQRLEKLEPSLEALFMEVIGE